MKIQRYVKVPQPVEAVQNLPENRAAVRKLLREDKPKFKTDGGVLFGSKKFGLGLARPGDWVLRDVSTGLCVSLDPKTFAEYYRKVD